MEKERQRREKVKARGVVLGLVVLSCLLQQLQECGKTIIIITTCIYIIGNSVIEGLLQFAARKLASYSDFSSCFYNRGGDKTKV